MKQRCYYIVIILFLLTHSPSFSQQETIKNGSFLINMGVTPQTIGNGLKPYGLLYELLKNHKIPVWWIINPSKTKDGIDFTHNGINYRGGTFVIPATYRTPAVNTTISNWQSLGVVGATTNADFTAQVFIKLKFAPHWTLDKQNGSIAVDFFTNAGIPSSAYGGSSSSGWKTPAQLNSCDDLFVMPHADPTWATHNNLYYWNQTYKGNIWAGCHAISVLENLTNPAGTVKMNFLTTNGLVNYSNHHDGSPAYSYLNHTDPVMQFMGALDGATTNGSEQIFLPALGSQWRSQSIIGNYDPDHQDIPSKSAGQASAVVYGRGFDDIDRGYVMYEAGHDITKGSVAEQVAAQRAFFNYSFFVTTKTRNYDITISPIPEFTVVNETYNLSFTVPPYVDLGQYTIKWTASAPGVFSPADNLQNVSFRPTGNAFQHCVITVTLTDACGREFVSSSTTYLTGVLAADKLLLKAVKKSRVAAELSWVNTEKEIHHFEIEKQQNNVYKTIGTVLNDNRHNAYQFADNNYNSSTSYYRLKAVLLSGAFMYSNMAVLGANSELGTLQLIENPVRNKIRIAHTFNSGEQLTIYFTDLQGRMLLNKTLMAVPGNIISVELPPLIRRGNYVLQVRSVKELKAFKVLVE